ncbi:hypothetical protein RZS08_13060, partial [Arthrospira platensis SPKY1]|nr:hypothetical protein [Arthrospira platensis SPKY1]
MWKIAKLHGVLIVIAGLVAILSPKPWEESWLVFAHQLVNLSLIGLGAFTFFTRKKRIFFLTLFGLFVALFVPSFFATNSYYLALGAFILYMEIIMISTVFFGKQKGMVIMIGIISLLVM